MCIRWFRAKERFPLLIGLGLLAFSLLIVGMTPVRAQEAEWTPLNGPHVPGGTVTALALAPSSPDLLYAALSSRLFKSEDAATSWTQVLTVTETLWSLAVDPVSPTVAYAGGEGALYKTKDGGLTWTQVYTLGRDVAIDPITPTNVYAVGQVSGGYFGLGVVARSTDGGETWTTSTLDSSSELSAIAVNPVTPTIVYIGGTRHSGKGSIVYKSVDGGLAWTAVLTANWGPPGFYGLEVASQNPQAIYGTRLDRVIKSTDGGLTWTELSGLPNNSYRLTLDPQQPETVYAADGWPKPDVSLYVSFDGGESWWQSTYRFPAAIYALTINPASPNVLYAGLQDYGVYKSSDVPRTQVEADHGVLSTWTEVNSGIRTLATVDALAVDPAEPNTLYAGSGTGRGGLFKSKDGGTTWMTVMTDTSIVSFAINPVTPTTILAGGPTYLYESEDGGVHWGRTSVESALSLAISTADPRVAYAGGCVDDASYPYPGVVARRVQDPQWGWWYWRTVPITCAHDISALAIHPIVTTTVFAGGVGQCWGAQDVIYRSSDGGLSWTEVLSDIGHGISDIVFAPHSPDTIYASSELWGIYKSTDGGDTWERQWNGLAGEGNYALTVDSLSRLYAGTREGVYWSVDGAEHWMLLETGMEEEWVKSLVIRLGDPAQLLAGTTSGVWRHWVPPHFGIYVPIIAKSAP